MARSSVVHQAVFTKSTSQTFKQEEGVVMEKRICVYCGSRSGARPAYTAAAKALGIAMVEAGYGLVYGGGNVGLMGDIADAVLAHGGTVLGVIPEALARREVAHTGLTKQYVVPDMHTRKMMMAQLADGFIAMPGGWGTLEELAEALTWLQLGFHQKPVGLLNVEGYYEPLLSFFKHMGQEDFLTEDKHDLLCVEPDVEGLMKALQGAMAKVAEKENQLHS
jgi:uncharacterized protein (TIGR00730 family)